MKFIQRIAWAATVVTYLLITLGGTVLATDSGLSCPDWPFCNGQAYYSGTYHAFLEQFHRFTAAAVSILIVLLVIGIIAWARKDRALLSLAIAAPVLLAIQIVLGGLTVLWKLPPQIITAHLGTALAIFAIMITIAVLSRKREPGKELPAKTRRFAQLAISNALLVYILMLFGSYVTGSGAALACPGWPTRASRLACSTSTPATSPPSTSTSGLASRPIMWTGLTWATCRPHRRVNGNAVKAG